MPKDSDFHTLAEGFTGFRRNAISDLTPPRISRAIEGGFYAGAQCALVLLTEALKINPMIVSKEVLDIFNECQAFFAIAKAQAESRIEESKVGNGSRKE